MADREEHAKQRVTAALEAHDQYYAAWATSRTQLAELFSWMVSAWLRPGSVLNKLERGRRPPCLRSWSVTNGAARGATTFRIAGSVQIDVALSGDPSTSYWTCEAVPISAKTGKDMSGRPSGAVRQSDNVTLRGVVFYPSPSLEAPGPAAMQAERDEFMLMVSEADRLLEGQL